MSTYETFVLVEIETVDVARVVIIPTDDQPHIEKRQIIKRTVRTYEERARADEDLELLSEITGSHATYRVDVTQHIER